MMANHKNGEDNHSELKEKISQFSLYNQFLRTDTALSSDNNASNKSHQIYKEFGN